MTATSARAATLRPGSLRALDSPATAMFVVLLIAVGLSFFHLTRDTTLWFDEWQWALDRRGWSVGAFLEPHNGHLSIVPIALYKLLFATAGLDGHAPYRVLLIVSELTLGTLLFAYARTRVGGVLALLVASLLLLLGAGWQNMLWPFQIGFLLSLVGGVGALLMLDRGTRGSDVAACGFLALSLGSSGVGIPVALGVIADVALRRRRWRDAWIVALPVGLFAVWWLVYADTPSDGTIGGVPRFAFESAAASLAALAGFDGDTALPEASTLLVPGRLLAVAALGLLAWRLVRLRRVPGRVITLFVMVGSFWAVTQLGRGASASPDVSRYLFVGALFVLLIGVELAAGVTVSWRAAALLAIAVAVATASHVGNLRKGAEYLRQSAEHTRGSLAAADLARPVADPGRVLRRIPGYPLVQVTASAYFDLEAAVGAPSVGEPGLLAASELARSSADAELAGIHALAPRPSTAASSSGDCPGRRSVTPGSRRDHLQLTLPPQGLTLRARGGPAEVAVRRFGTAFQPVGTIAASTPAIVRARADRSPRPWQLRVVPAVAAVACEAG